ncbi:ABC transporter permease [Legionella impletisoli]|uniref:Transport permease protein n=1 Tax=Legionella impletisoli TaxID=343510 RepID=A0A917JMZ2_9GAMM|nr:ABC transporter permease [Legionella impletisoli]GGI77220.1 hypothetical protein GCM10007966_02410 [Legionella impletisoli]
MAHTTRSPWQIMYASVCAIVITEIQKKFLKTINSQRSFSFFLIVLEPLIHVAIWMLLYWFIANGQLTPKSMPISLFVVLGVMPFLLFRTVLGSSKNCIKSNKNFYVFRQIKPIDPIIALLVSELLVSALVFVILLAGFSWFGVLWRNYAFSYWLLNLFSYALLLLGLSLIFAVTCFFFNFMKIILDIILRLSYLFSGIFFSAESLPQPVRDIMLYNPMFQFIELSRETFKPTKSYLAYGSSSYLLLVAAIALTLGLGLYLAFSKRIMIEIEQK